jgi:cysteine-rich repeat protein
MFSPRAPQPKTRLHTTVSTFACCIGWTVCLLAAASCGDEKEKYTAVELRFRFDPQQLTLDAFAVHIQDSSGSALFEPVIVPAAPGPVLDSGEETLFVIVDDDLDGSTLTFAATGLYDSVPVAHAQGSITVTRHQTVTLMLDLSALEGCGNGVLENGEQCDDQNLLDGDGCSATCTVEDGYTCTGEPSFCEPICGNGAIHGSETCDDQNTAPDDGCAPDCTIEAGWQCFGQPSVCVRLCGNGEMSGNEECDDGNTNPDDGCAPDCTVEPGWQCSGSPSDCEFLCGNGQLNGNEACDDGNTNPDDGCAPDCTVEPGWECDEDAPSNCNLLCGNGTVDATEACDDGNNTDSDGCSSDCTVEPDYACVGENPSVCGPKPCLSDSVCQYICNQNAEACVLEEDIIFVDCDASGAGNGSLAAPYQTLSAALGTSPSFVYWLSSSCTETDPITVQQHTFTLVAQHGATLTSDADPALLLEECTARIRGITILGTTTVNSGGLEAINSTTLELTESVFGPGQNFGVSCHHQAHCFLDRLTIVENDLGGLLLHNDAAFTVTNSIIVKNGLYSLNNQGGVYISVDGTYPQLFYNNTVADNVTNGAAGVYCANEVDLYNSIIWNNTDTQIDPNCHLYYSNISATGHSGNGNINTDPDFIDPDNLNYHLNNPTNNACVDAGDPTSDATTVGPYDIDGQTRIQGGQIDMGADEAG